MPIYEYICDKCSQTTEALRPMADADEPIACESCGSRRTQRAHSVFSAGATQPDTPLPMGGCGRCGDPNGPCSLPS